MDDLNAAGKALFEEIKALRLSPIHQPQSHIRALGRKQPRRRAESFSPAASSRLSGLCGRS